MGFDKLLKSLVEQIKETKDFGVGLPDSAAGYGIGAIPGWISSGNALLDAILGGGLPLGRISEWFSTETSEGKTTTAVDFAIETQRVGGLPVWLESEAAMDWQRAERRGLKLEHVLRWSPPHLEAGFNYITRVLENVAADKQLASKPTLIVWDTITFCEMKEVLDGDQYAGGRCNRQRSTKMALNKLTNMLWESKAHLLLISHTHASMDQYGPKVVTSGGSSIRQHCSIRTQLHSCGKLKDGEEIVGIQVNVESKKNKTAPPYRGGVLNLYFGDPKSNWVGGYNECMSLADFCINNNVTDVVRKDPAGWYSLMVGTPQECKCRLRAIPEKAAEIPELLPKMREAVWAKFPLPPDRELDPEIGWVMPKDRSGSLVFEVGSKV